MGRALVVVDVQHDFLPGGALGVPGGDEILAPIAALLADARGEFDLVAATRDWHPPDHGSFDTADPPGRWPVHCVQGTPGAELSERLDRDRIDVVVDKGQPRDTDGYSGFDGTELAALLRERGVDELVVVGLAQDHCVRATALDARAEGFAVTVLAGATRPVEAGPGEAAFDELRDAGVTVA